MEAFPNAKVILTVRDPSRWYTSVRDSIYQWKVVAAQTVPRLFLAVVGQIRGLDVAMNVSVTKPEGFEHSA